MCYYGVRNNKPRMIYNRMDTKIHLHRSKRSPLMRDVFVLQKLELAITTTIKSHFHSINKRLLLFTVFCEHPCLLRPLVPSLSLCFVLGVLLLLAVFFKHKQTDHNVLAGFYMKWLFAYLNINHQYREENVYFCLPRFFVYGQLTVVLLTVTNSYRL